MIVGFTTWIMFFVFFVTLSALICRYLSKQAIGSGIPEMKVSPFLTLCRLLLKILGNNARIYAQQLFDFSDSCSQSPKFNFGPG